MGRINCRERILRGHEIEMMEDEELKAAVEETTIFAKLSPLQKSQGYFHAQGQWTHCRISWRWDQ